ncbi:hypothetical protein ACQ5RK_05900 [Latilactobacillus curvatus]
MGRTRLSNFTQGVIHFGEIKTKRNEKKEKTGFEFIEQGFLFFNYKQIREEDQSHFDAGKATATNLKVQTFYKNAIDKQVQKALINDDYYEITAIDPSNDRKTMYWYLTKKESLNAI